MLKGMQAKYADKPVRFLLVPCNQFGAQEPKANSVIKEFAEQSVSLAKDGAGSNVIMLAKSNLNGVKCTSSGGCTPSSDVCCPSNDAVYDYLLSATPPGTIGWNFDKVVVGLDGKPYSGETIMDGNTVEAGLSQIIDKQLAASQSSAVEMLALRNYLDTPGGVPVLAAACAVFFLLLAAFKWRRSLDQDASSNYIHLVA
jgi:glutathione peroxidase-family protein